MNNLLEQYYSDYVRTILLILCHIIHCMLEKYYLFYIVKFQEFIFSNCTARHGLVSDWLERSLSNIKRCQHSS